MSDRPILKIRNWQQFQHYTDRRPPWIKLHRTLLDDFDFHSMSDATRALLPCLWLIASEYENGEIPDDAQMISFRVHMHVKKVQDCLNELKEKDFLVASIALAPRYQDAILEVETEEEKERKKETEPLVFCIGCQDKNQKHSRECPSNPRNKKKTRSIQRTVFRHTEYQKPQWVIERDEREARIAAEKAAEKKKEEEQAEALDKFNAMVDEANAKERKFWKDAYDRAMNKGKIA